MFSCIAFVSGLLTSKLKLVQVDNHLCIRSCLFRQCRDWAATVIRYASSTPEVLVIILGLGTEIRKADLVTTLTISLDAAKVSHQDNQRAPHLTISQFLFDRDTSNGGTGSLCLDEGPPSAFETIEVLCKGGICRTYMKYV